MQIDTVRVVGGITAKKNISKKIIKNYSAEQKKYE